MLVWVLAQSYRVQYLDQPHSPNNQLRNLVVVILPISHLPLIRRFVSLHLPFRFIWRVDRRFRQIFWVLSSHLDHLESLLKPRVALKVHPLLTVFIMILISFRLQLHSTLPFFSYFIIQNKILQISYQTENCEESF